MTPIHHPALLHFTPQNNNNILLHPIIPKLHQLPQALPRHHYPPQQLVKNVPHKMHSNRHLNRHHRNKLSPVPMKGGYPTEDEQVRIAMLESLEAERRRLEAQSAFSATAGAGAAVSGFATAGMSAACAGAKPAPNASPSMLDRFRTKALAHVSGQAGKGTESAKKRGRALWNRSYNGDSVKNAVRDGNFANSQDAYNLVDYLMDD